MTRYADPVAQAEIDRLKALLELSEQNEMQMGSRLVSAQAEIDRLRAGEDASEKDPDEMPTPGQLWHFLLEASEVNRLRTLAKFQEAADEASRCFLEDHEGRLAEREQ